MTDTNANTERFLPAEVWRALRNSTDPTMPLIAASYIPLDLDREDWQDGDVVRDDEHRLYGYLGQGRWRVVLNGEMRGRHELPEVLNLVVRDGFPICTQHRWGEILTREQPEPPVGSVVVPADGLAHVRIAEGWTEYEHASEPISWDHMLSYEGAVRLVHWSPRGVAAPQPCRPQEDDLR